MSVLLNSSSEVKGTTPAPYTAKLPCSGVKKYSTEMGAQELLDCFNKLPITDFHNLGDGSLDLVDNNGAPPSKPKIRLTEKQLRPKVLSVHIQNRNEAFCPELYELCLDQPLVVIRGMTSALGFNFELFSTKTLVEAHPDHPIEVRSQLQQNKDKNMVANENPVWLCFSEKDASTLLKCATYQSQRFLESEENKAAGMEDAIDSIRNRRKAKFIKFGTNLDLSDGRKWGPQQAEINKLPPWIRVKSAGNMLSHVGYTLLGMNTVQAYLKVPGCRTPGHQENNNFCSVNINIGPEDTEWFAVPHEYWGCVERLCTKNNISYLSGSWWPNLQELYDEGCPVFRFIQRPGEIVWLNSGCVHWVQALGFCNNVAWNVGPLSVRQYELAIERYEWNKINRFQSVVPMLHLSWNLAKNLKITEPGFFNFLKTVLMKTLAHCIQLLKFAHMKKVKIVTLPKASTRCAPYCSECYEEVFNIMLTRENDRVNIIYCIDCARSRNSDLEGFVCLQQYSLEYLFNVYDTLKLHQHYNRTFY